MEILAYAENILITILEKLSLNLFKSAYIITC